jgi:hypothetical protein
VTPAPDTPAPLTPAPVTDGPITPAPVTPAPFSPAPVSPAPTCVCVPKVLDFSGYQNGQCIYGSLDDYCVSITAFAKTAANGERRGFTPIDNAHIPAGGAARIYDTGNGTNGDVDLFTPTPKLFSGPQFGPRASCSDCFASKIMMSFQIDKVPGPDGSCPIEQVKCIFSEENDTIVWIINSRSSVPSSSDRPNPR